MSSAYNYLVDHAIKNVWCTPDQDLQYIFKLARITPTSGVINHARVIWRDIPLPDTTSRWHVFQIGQVHPLILGLLPKRSKWIPFSETMNVQEMVVDIYTVNGIQLPRFQTYYMYNSDKDLIVAVRKNPLIPYKFESDDVYLRLYSNAYVNSGDGQATNAQIFTNGIVAGTTDQILALQNQYNTYAAKAGSAYAFVNGVKVKAVSLLTVQVGDSVEFIYDSTVYKVVEFHVADLHTFTSSLDSKLKYLLHYSGGSVNRIDYQDDIDVYIVQKYGNNQERSTLYHKNNADALRMVTHRDYSIVTAYIEAYARFLETIDGVDAPINPTSLYVRLYIRNGGYNRPLVYEANRIFELYKMADADIMRAMLGIDAVVPSWFAPNLENSAYTKIMRVKSQEITPVLVEQAYGYNGMAKVLGDMPQRPTLTSGQLEAEVPYGVQIRSTAYEYDTDGLYLGRYFHIGGSRYLCSNSNCGYVEFIPGTGSKTLDETYNPTTMTWDPILDYRVYACNKVNGTPNDQWVDITGDITKYTLVNNVFTWISTDTNLFPMVRSNATFVAYDLQLFKTRGVYSFDISAIENRFGLPVNTTMQIPMDSIDVIMGKHTLARGLDYFVDFPHVVITNKEYLVPNSLYQDVHIRMVGHCSSTLEMIPPADTGYVVHGVLSNNNAYDIRDDRVLQIVVDGKLKARSDVSFAEDGVSAQVQNILNGRPYQLREVIIPMRGLAPDYLYDLVNQSRTVDQQVSDYLSLKLPQVNPTTPSAITARYQVYSPFLSRIVDDLLIGVLVPPTVSGSYGRQVVTDLCQPYESLLAFDPTQTGKQPSSDYVIIHPHSQLSVVTLSIKSYKFLQEVITYYSRGLVSISSFVNLS